MDGSTAEKELKSSPNKSYLLRWSEKQNGYVVSYKLNQSVVHVGPVQEQQGIFYMVIDNSNRAFNSLEEVIDFLITNGTIGQPFKNI